MKTIVITVFHAFIARNVLYGGFLDALKAAGVRVVLLVPSSKADYFRDLFGADAVIEPLDTEALANNRVNLSLTRISFLLIKSHYLWYKRAERRDAGGVRERTKYLLEQAFVVLFAGRRILRPLFRSLFAAAAKTSEITSILQRHEPDLVFVTDLFNPADYLVLLAARRLSLSDAAMIRSWDNASTKGLLPTIPSKLIVNTDILKSEAVTVHGVPAASVSVIGMPQFDLYFASKPLPRDEFFRELGVDAKKKLIVFAPGGTVLTDIDWQLCNILNDALKSRAIKSDAHILVRNHPNHPADLSRFESDADFTIEFPGKRFGSNLKEAELSRSEQAHLRDSLANADVVIWVATTLGVDSSAFDKPQIMINFDGNETRPYLRSVRKYFDEDHMRNLIATGGVRVVRSKAELVDAIYRYIENPSLEGEGRRRIRETQLVYTDGRSGARLTGIIMQLLGKAE